MAYRGVYVDYSEYEWMVYEDTYNRSITQILVDQDYEEFIQENFLDDEGNYHLKIEDARISTTIEDEQITMYIPEVSHNSDDQQFDNDIMEMNRTFVDSLVSNEITVDDITGHVLDVLMSGMSFIGKIQTELDSNFEKSSNLEITSNHSVEIDQESNSSEIVKVSETKSEKNGEYQTISPPISVSSIDSGYTDDDRIVTPTFINKIDNEAPPPYDKSKNKPENSEKDEIPVWLKEGKLENTEYNDINAPQYSMASVIARQLQEAGNKKNRKHNKKSHKNTGRHNKVRTTIDTYSNGIVGY